MTIRWYHFETRVLNLHDPTLIEIQADVERLRSKIKELFFQVLRLAASILAYTSKTRPEKFGSVHTWI